MTVAGIILCGGRSSRMGRAKAWLPFGEEVLLQRVVRILGEVLNPLVVVASPDQDVPKLPNHVEVVRDAEAYLGPLAGLVAGLNALAGRSDAAYLSACDLPFLKPEFVKRVADLPEDERRRDRVHLPRIGGYLHPLAAMYPFSVRDKALSLLNGGTRRMLDLFDHVPVHILQEADLADLDPKLESLRNINTAEEYAQALADYNSTSRS